MNIATFVNRPIVGRNNQKAVERTAAGKPQFHTADDRVYSEGQTANNVYRVESGAVRVFRYLPDGKRYILSLCSCGDWFGIEGGSRRS
ncbi:MULTISPECIES: cyclic nucleotide-binding domain-containing protein [unclassified Rhizobium]|jgi:CRP/FNR family transcriptional regulator/CRP/FNR family nitrogen fixation transcriptional regulator|uniref:cyclic nucleotide-binding domain-containing protein n=1 Tax=unclassified Rhizobium TaxID=2613769 RepID=UPI00037B1B7D|nr:MULTISPECIES: cyclic nucleotide-binding domain-containing protein [unclassified Rhizobium]MBB3446966.1 CRP-like cAMP-binding protein [Rhizobium sp. BK379]MBB3565506.1 CRP-like cAMP-binding protein [Rhizobium sp. BK512]